MKFKIEELLEILEKEGLLREASKEVRTLAPTSFTDNSKEAEPDITAMALTALKNYSDRKEHGYWPIHLPKTT